MASGIDTPGQHFQGYFVLLIEFIDFTLVFIVDIGLDILDLVSEYEGPHLPHNLQIPDRLAILILPALAENIEEQFLCIVLDQPLEVFELPDELVEQ